MILVLDASAAIELVLKRRESAVLDEALTEADLVLVPDLYVAEVSNALWKYASEAPDAEALMDLVEDTIALPDSFVESRELYREAFRFSVHNKHPVYDSLYLILARRNNATLATLDRRLRSLARSEGLPVVPEMS